MEDLVVFGIIAIIILFVSNKLFLVLGLGFFLIYTRAVKLKNIKGYLEDDPKNESQVGENDEPEFNFSQEEPTVFEKILDHGTIPERTRPVDFTMTQKTKCQD